MYSTLLTETRLSLGHHYVGEYGQLEESRAPAHFD
jgi:hypothetical protein